MSEPHRREETLLATLSHSPLVRAALTVSAVALGALGVLESRLHAHRHVTLSRRSVDEASIPSPRAVRLLSLGHNEWAADILWVNALVYFGESLSAHTQQRHIQRYAEAIEQADPHFRAVYLWGATVSVYNARVIRRESVENAIRHLERGLRVFPDDGEMLYQLGFDYFYELPPKVEDPEERRAFRRRGAEYLRRASAVGYGPQWLALTAAGALEESGLVDSAVEQLRTMYLRAEDPALRARIASRIEEFARTRGTVDPFVAAARRFETDRRASFPYLRPIHYLFVGPPVPGVAATPPPQPDQEPAISSAPGSASP